MRFTEDLTYRLVAYMRDRHQIELSSSQAEDFLTALADLYEVMGRMCEGARGRDRRLSAGADAADLICPHN